MTLLTERHSVPGKSSPVAIGASVVLSLGLAVSTLAVPAAAAASTADAPTIPTSEVTWTKEGAGDLGSAISRISCDVNGDGHADTVTGDW